MIMPDYEMLMMMAMIIILKIAMTITWSLCSSFCHCCHKQILGGTDTQLLQCLDNPATTKT